MIKKKRQVFLLLYSPAIDGIGRALLGFLSSVDFSHTEIHLGFFKQGGPLLSLLPSSVVCHYISGVDEVFPPPSIAVIRENLRRKKGKIALLSFLLLLCCKIDRSPCPYFRYLFRDAGVPSIQFDEAHAFHGPWQIIDYCVCRKIKAKQRFGWIHVDVSKMAERLGGGGHIRAAGCTLYGTRQEAERLVETEMARCTGT